MFQQSNGDFQSSDMPGEYASQPYNIGVRRVWDELGIRGEGALIGSLDTGVDVNHPSLADRWRGNHAPWQECWFDVVDDVTEYPEDHDGHGTHCTGTMTGVAPDDYLAGDPYRSLIDCHHARDVLGWEARHSWRDSSPRTREPRS